MTHEQNAARMREWRKLNPEKARARMRAWRKANPEKIKMYCQNSRAARARSNRTANLKRYGLTPTLYNQLVISQKGLCAICSNNPRPDEKLSVDHSHISGEVRALLCMHCNHGLGSFKDNPCLLQAAINYLEKHR